MPAVESSGNPELTQATSFNKCFGAQATLEYAKTIKHPDQRPSQATMYGCEPHHFPTKTFQIHHLDLFWQNAWGLTTKAGSCRSQRLTAGARSPMGADLHQRRQLDD